MREAKMTMQSINPASEEIVASFEEHDEAEVDRALEAATAVFADWRARPFRERSDLLLRAAAYLREHKARFAGLITTEMGKPITQAEAEVEKCAWNCEYYAENGERFLADREVETTAQRSLIAYEPLGTVLAVMPWNFPFWQVLRFAAPALAAGNVAVLKHASNVPQCALAIEEVFQETGFPQGVFHTLLISSKSVGRVIADPRVRAVTLTGSDATGAEVAAAAGRHLKKTVLELGGSDAYVVLADADLEKAAEVAVQARFQNTGQSCIAAKRFIVDRSVADEFEQRFIAAVERLKVGGPMERTTQVGPLARPDLVDGLDKQVRDSVAQGAEVRVGGQRIDGRGYFYAPTVLVGATEAMPVCREETFGPVAPLTRAENEDDAIRMANDSVYGLGASLWTRDLERGDRLARRLEAGAVFVNGMVASDPRLPFGGIKRSGYGRELSEIGMHEFLNVKSIWLGPAKPAETPPAKPAE
jgi:succinate-semialdehyde dehydrogenase/glutarate-semialdehyde dehydrogenase